MKIEVIYEDNHLLVINKPQGIPVQSDGTKKDLLEYAREYLKTTYNKPGNVFVGMVHRLDTNVGGVVIFAKTSKAASRISAEIRERKVEKMYLCVVEGIVKTEGLITHSISKDEENKKAILDEVNGKDSNLELKVLSVNNNLTLCEVNLLTGRYHQIRFQLSQIGHPIYGDKKYGSQFASKDIALWCFFMKVKHPVKDEYLSFKTLPDIQSHPWNQLNITSEIV